MTTGLESWTGLLEKLKEGCSGVALFNSGYKNKSSWIGSMWIDCAVCLEQHSGDKKSNPQPVGSVGRKTAL